MNISIKVKDAIKYFGTKAKIAKALDITPQSINSWGNEENFIPETSANKLYIITEHKLGNMITDGIKHT